MSSKHRIILVTAFSLHVRDREGVLEAQSWGTSLRVQSTTQTCRMDCGFHRGWAVASFILLFILQTLRPLHNGEPCTPGKQRQTARPRLEEPTDQWERQAHPQITA